jgi:hypothetical protein
MDFWPWLPPEPGAPVVTARTVPPVATSGKCSLRPEAGSPVASGYRASGSGCDLGNRVQRDVQGADTNLGSRSAAHRREWYAE